MSGRSAIVAVSMAFFVGVIGALSLKPISVVDETYDASDRPVVRWRVPSAFGTNLPALGENALEFAMAEAIARAHGGALAVQIGEGDETVLVLDLPAPP